MGRFAWEHDNMEAFLAGHGDGITKSCYHELGSQRWDILNSLSSCGGSSSLRGCRDSDHLLVSCLLVCPC